MASHLISADHPGGPGRRSLPGRDPAALLAAVIEAGRNSKDLSPGRPMVHAAIEAVLPAPDFHFDLDLFSLIEASANIVDELDDEGFGAIDHGTLLTAALLLERRIFQFQPTTPREIELKADFIRRQAPVVLNLSDEGGMRAQIDGLAGIARRYAATMRE